MANYVEIDSAAFEAFLASHGFVKVPTRDEVVFEKSHPEEPRLKVKVYTSSRIGSAVARDVGKDAIRCVATFSRGEKTYGIFRGKRIHRTSSQESVHARTLDRINQAFARCEAWLSEQATRNAARRSDVASERAGEQDAHSRSEQAHEARREAAGVSGEHFGKLGDRGRLTVRVVSRKPFGPSNAPDKFLFTLQDNAGHTLAYWSKKDLLQENETYDLGFKVIGFNTFRGQKQSIIDEVAGKRIVL